MTNDLKQLLHDSTADAPAEPHSVHDIVRSAQRSHRRHTVRLVGGSVLALALVAGVGYAAVVNGGKDDAQPAHTGPETIRVDVKDARKAVPGEDYESLAVFDGLPLYGLKWSPDDLIPVQDGRQWKALDGKDGTSIADLGDGKWGPEYLGEGVAVYWKKSKGAATIHVRDLEAGTTVDVPVEYDGIDRARDSEFLGVADDRVYVKFQVLGKTKAIDRFVVVSAPVDGSTGFRREVDENVTTAMLSSGSLAWVTDWGEPARVRSLATGETKSFEHTPEDREKCFVQIFGLSPERIATTYRCNGVSTPEEGAIRVWSFRGDPTVVLTGRASFGIQAEPGLSDDLLMLHVDSGKRVHTYVYRFDGGEVLDLGSVRNDEFLTPEMMPSMAGADRITFPAATEKLRLAALK